MELPRSRLSQFSGLSIILIAFVIFAAAIIAYSSAVSIRDQMRSQLNDRAATVAVALDSTKVAELNALEQSGADVLSSPVYRELKSKLTALKQSNTDAYSIYLAQLSDDSVYFTVDSEIPDSTYYSDPGEEYPEATPLFKSVFKSSVPVVEGPLGDSYGSWVSGLAPVIDLTSGETVAVLGIDIDSASYTNAIWQQVAIPLLVALLFIGLIVFYEASRQRQQQLLQMRSELVSIASHELRTPITGMRWAAESLLKNPLDTTQKTLLTAMYDSIMNMQAGTEDILQLSRVTRNKDQDLKSEPVDMSATIAEICKAMALTAQKKNIKLTMDETWNTPVMIDCDKIKIKRALHNVISNAVKYTRENTAVTIHYQKTDKFHQILVTDQGIGIPKEEQSRVFAGFYRASNAKASGESGTGLGLYLTKTILEQHKGKVEFNSVEGEGTTFILSLPDKK